MASRNLPRVKSTSISPRIRQSTCEAPKPKTVGMPPWPDSDQPLPLPYFPRKLTSPPQSLAQPSAVRHNARLLSLHPMQSRLAFLLAASIRRLLPLYFYRRAIQKAMKKSQLQLASWPSFNINPIPSNTHSSASPQPRKQDHPPTHLRPVNVNNHLFCPCRFPSHGTYPHPQATHDRP